MNARDILRVLAEAGITVRRDGERIVVRRAGGFDPELLQLLRASRDEIGEALDQAQAHAAQETQE